MTRIRCESCSPETSSFYKLRISVCFIADTNFIRKSLEMCPCARRYVCLPNEFIYSLIYNALNWKNGFNLIDNSRKKNCLFYRLTRMKSSDQRRSKVKIIPRSYVAISSNMFGVFFPRPIFHHQAKRRQYWLIFLRIYLFSAGFVNRMIWFTYAENGKISDYCREGQICCSVLPHQAELPAELINEQK